MIRSLGLEGMCSNGLYTNVEFENDIGIWILRVDNASEVEFHVVNAEMGTAFANKEVMFLTRSTLHASY